jgi:PPOX class probable F420-dependent enzyme
MHEMSAAERREFLLGGTRTGMLGTTRADGSPHVVPIWFVLDGDTVVFTCDGHSVKAAALRRDPRVSICVDDQQPPYSFVTMRGQVTLSEDLDQLRHWATRIGGRYMGEANAEAFGARNAVPGELLVRLTPAHIVARAAIAD